MNKKGYTLVEIIAVIALVVTIGAVGAVGMSTLISKSKDQRYNDMIADIKAAANTYFSICTWFIPSRLYSTGSSAVIMFPDTLFSSERAEYSYLNENLYGNGSVEIPMSTLKETLLVDEDLKNPKDNQFVSGCVLIEYDNEITYKVCPYEECTCSSE